MIIDAHCHVWPDHIAAKVLAARPASLDPVHDGTLDGLRATMAAAGIGHAMVLGVANVARTVQRTNEWIGAVDRSMFTPFGTVHPDLPPDGQRQVAAGQRHPRRETAPAVPGPVARRAAGDRVAARAGGGGRRGDHARRRRRLGRGQSTAGRPPRCGPRSTRCPTLTLIACHFGGYHRLERGRASSMVGSRAYLETSWPPRLADLDRERIRSLIRRHGADRVIFGSDWPMADPAAEIAAVRDLGLDPAETEAILGGTLSGILGLST